MTYCSNGVSSIKDCQQDEGVIVAGVIADHRITLQRGRTCRAEDGGHHAPGSGCKRRGVLFTEAYLANAELVQLGAVVFAEGHVDHKRGEPQIVIQQIHPPGEATSRLGGSLEIDLGPALEAMMAGTRSPSSAGCSNEDRSRPSRATPPK